MLQEYCNTFFITYMFYMIRFIKGAIREFRHVVWPTRKETQKYFSLVLAILVAFGIYLFIASNIFSEVIFGLKNLLGTWTEVTGQSGLTEEDIDALFSNEVQIETTTDETTISNTISGAEGETTQETAKQEIPTDEITE